MSGDLQPSRIDPLRGALGGAFWSLSGTIAAVMAWEIWLMGWRIRGSSLLDTGIRGGAIILPAFACCYAVARIFGRRLSAPAVASVYCAAWHVGAHYLVALVLLISQRGAPAPATVSLPLIVGALSGLWLPRVLPRVRQDR